MLPIPSFTFLAMLASGFPANSMAFGVPQPASTATWVLCPTCHRLLDRMNYTLEELGLK